MTGAYVTYNGGESWRMFNLRSPVHFFVFDPLDSNIVYANALALYKSTDKGHTWQVVYPVAEDIVRVISKGDHAENVIVTKDSTRRKVQALAVDPSNSEKLYAVISIDTATALYVSANGGGSWVRQKELPEAAGNLFITPGRDTSQQTIYITTAKGVYVRSGGNWKFNSIPAGIQQFTTYAAGYDSIRQHMVLYSIAGKSYLQPGPDSSGIFISENDGVTWENRQAGICRYATQGTGFPEWRTIATSAAHPGTVYVSYNNLHLADTLAIGVARSEDYGKTWLLVWEDRIWKGGYTVSPNFSDGWLNERFGPSWGENPFDIGVSPVNPTVCYATDFGRTVKTTNGGNSWAQVYTRQKGDAWSSRGLEVTTNYTVVFDPFDTAHLFICATDVGLMESRDGGNSWKSDTKNNGIPAAWVNNTYWLAFDGEVKGKAWAVMSAIHDLPRPKMWRKAGISAFNGGIVTTDDGGNTWRPVSTAIGEAAFTHILIDPASKKASRTLYACAFGKGVYKSLDGGKTWQLKNKGLPQREPFAWRIVRLDKDGVLFLIISRRNEKVIGNIDDGAIYRSDDGAETWKPLTLPEGTNGPTSLVVDADHPARLLMSAWGKANEGAFTEDTGGGIFISGDEGKTWKQVLGSDQHIHDITYDGSSHTYYACGFNSSAYRSQDNGVTWQRIPGYNFKWGKRVEPDPVHPGKIFIITFGGGVRYGPGAGDSTQPEDITTPVLSYH
ncbi:MAG TPA: hypothetical protein VGC22_08810 [Chitinophaga sp.]